MPSVREEMLWEYNKGWKAASEYTEAWKTACLEARDERDVALRRVKELEARLERSNQEAVKALDGQWDLIP